MSILDKLFGGEDSGRREGAAKPDAPMQRVLDVLQNDLHAIPFDQLTPEEARRQPTPADAMKKILAETGQAPDPLDIATRDFVIPGPAGGIPARLYGPRKSGKDDDASALLPVVVYWHGGGWVLADLDTYDASPRGMARLAECIVVSCHYRQAPEDRFPAAHEDAFAAYRWVLENAQAFGGDPRRVAVMGESAGGNLACNVAIRARDEGIQAPAYMALVYPVAGADMTTPSYVENAGAMPLGKPQMEWFVRQVFDSPDQARDPRINLVEADLHGLPDATVVTAQIDPLRSEGDLLAERLEAGGAHIAHKTYHGSTHEFFGLAPVVPDAEAAQAFVAHHLKKAFGTPMVMI